MKHLAKPITDAADATLAELVLNSARPWMLNEWDGFDVYGDGGRYVRTTVEDGLFHIYSFDGYDMAWSIEFSQDVPVELVDATILAAYEELD